MQKPGIICLILVLILGSVGAGYAWWSDAVTVKKYLESGALNLGIREIEGSYGNPGDEAGFVECLNGPYKFKLNGEYYSQSVSLNVYGTPSFAPYCTFEIANGGTVPAKSKDITYEWFGYSPQSISVGYWSITPDRGTWENGSGLATLRKVMNDLIIEPGQTARIVMQLIFEQRGPAEGNITLPCRQWNGIEWDSR